MVAEAGRRGSHLLLPGLHSVDGGVDGVEGPDGTDGLVVLDVDELDQGVDFADGRSEVGYLTGGCAHGSSRCAGRYGCCGGLRCLLRLRDGSPAAVAERFEGSVSGDAAGAGGGLAAVD